MILAITIYTNYDDYKKIASGYVAIYSYRHFADALASLMIIAVRQRLTS